MEGIMKGKTLFSQFQEQNLNRDFVAHSYDV